MSTRTCGNCDRLLISGDKAVRYCKACVQLFKLIPRSHSIWCRDTCSCWRPTAPVLHLFGGLS